MTPLKQIEGPITPILGYCYPSPTHANKIVVNGVKYEKAEFDVVLVHANQDSGPTVNYVCTYEAGGGDNIVGKTKG
jgi:hypothetical protein